MGKDTWYRPHHYVVRFIPPSPGGEHIARLQRIVREEGNKIEMKIKLVEQSRISVRVLPTRPNLSGCLFPNCNIEEDKAIYSRRGVNYTGKCTVWGNQCRGETEAGAHTRICQYQTELQGNVATNSMATHLSGEHPEYSREPQAIKFSVTRTRPKCLERQVREAVQLANMDPDRIINTHMEFVAPAIQRMTHTNLLDDGRNRGVCQNLLEWSSFAFYLCKISFEYVIQNFNQRLGHIVTIDKVAIKTARCFEINCKYFVLTPTGVKIKS